MTIEGYRELTKQYLNAEKEYTDYLQELTGGSLGLEVTEIKIQNKQQLDKLNQLSETRTLLFEEWRKAIISM